MVLVIVNILTRITYFRELRSWTEYRLAEESGIQQTLISQWHKKELTPSLASIESLCKAFGITLSQFFAEGAATVDLTAEQAILLDSWTALSKNKQLAVLKVIEALQTPD